MAKAEGKKKKERKRGTSSLKKKDGDSKILKEKDRSSRKYGKKR